MNLETFSEPAGPAGGATAVLSDVDLPSGMCYPQTLQPLVRIREEHNISRRDIDPDALKVLYRLARNDYIAYLVGGGVRDLLLGRKPKDFDISTNARPEQIRSLFRNCILIGRRFRLAHVRYGEKIIETSTFRRTPETNGDPSDPDTDLFQRDDNLFGSPQEDALRRDFTVNGLFYDIESFSIIDYVGGMEDLAAKRIRSIGDPCIRFREDPIRMIRAVRFASRLDFTLDSDTEDAIHKHGEELAKAAPARLLEEICRLFAFSSGWKAVRLLASTGLLKVILPEVAEALDSSGEGELFWKRLKALDEGDTVLPDATPALIFSVLLLDPMKKRYGRDWAYEDFPKLKFDKVHSFLEPLSQRLRFPRKMVDRIVHIYLSQHRFLNPGGKKGALANFVTQDSFHESLALSEILLATEGGQQTRLNQWRDMLAERIYSRDDNGRSGGNGGGQRRPSGEQQPQPNRAERREEQDGDDKSVGKMSRSARRRRNRRLKRAAGDSRQDGQRSEDVAESAVRADSKADSDSQSPGASVAPTAPVAAETANATVAALPEESGKKSEKSRARRGRGKKKSSESNSSDAPVSEARVSRSDVGEPETPPQPLTAAAFYTPEPEPPVKKKSGGRKTKDKESAGKQAAKKSSGAKSKGKAAAADGAEEKTSGKPKPLPMDRADEADIPMHWLDEI